MDGSYENSKTERYIVDNMASNSEYLLILLDSLKKKINLLDIVIAENEKQTSLLKEEKFDEDAFMATINHKEELIEQINVLDDCFESVYRRISDEVTANPHEYSNELGQLQKMIPEIASRSASIEASEKRNNELMKTKLVTLNKQIYQAKASNRVASSYFNTMNNMNIVDPYFMDKKK